MDTPKLKRPTLIAYSSGCIMPHQSREEYLRKRREYGKRYYQEHREEVDLKHKAYKKANIDKYREWGRKHALAHNQRLKLEVFTHYSRGLPQCANCSERRMSCLSIDHKNGRARTEKMKTGLRGVTFYRWLRTSNYPEGYQVLCMNCQWVKRFENKEYNQRARDNGS